MQTPEQTEQYKSVQAFLVGEGFPLEIDGIWGEKSRAALHTWQQRNGLVADGLIGAKTLGRMFAHGKMTTPVRDDFPPNLLGEYKGNLAEMFGILRYKDNKTSDGGITLLGNYRDNLVKFDLSSIFTLSPDSIKINYFHHRVYSNLMNAFGMIKEWYIDHHILSCAGSFYPRFIRGSRKTLSTHSWGVAIDLNAPQNGLGKRPARRGQTGCLYDVVMIMQAWGFYWGGWFSRCDGMHFESYINYPLTRPLEGVVSSKQWLDWKEKYFPNSKILF